MATFMKNITLVSQSAALFRDEKLKEAEVTGYQAKYILAVCNEEGISQDKLAKTLFVNKSNVARQMSALERTGYITRVQSDADRRVYCVYPTDKAKKLYPEIKRINAQWRGKVCEGMSEEEQETLARLVEKLVENAKKYMSALTE
jgi:DNA-binding MarR family transcriptional regulator